MHDIPLNDTQRIFAEKNHNLVYKFLHEKNLPAINADMSLPVM